MRQRKETQINKSKSKLFEKINKQDKPLAKKIKEKGKSANTQNR